LADEVELESEPEGLDETDDESPDPEVDGFGVEPVESDEVAAAAAAVSDFESFRESLR
jgi:hypothetical protein